MDFSEIWDIVILVIAILSTASWGVLFKKGRNVWKKLRELGNQYSEAVADDNISDEERIQIADTVVEIIIDTMSIWQALSNLVRAIIPVLRKTK